ncbi:hypothetical protein DAEQUDRAFT_756286 [Daedalea quercina L-15889]|uniref:Aminoglycoside phosphotransferase domain-containing protein n=1 Tax=Daedalea quercina L-15889 TaxID=1314783 RepID=A0A165RFT4_9APHY|nr:hypothetical protein DAEQUDRAFT_756286 [Daedalea quercina L-15889]
MLAVAWAAPTIQIRSDGLVYARGNQQNRDSDHVLTLNGQRFKVRKNDDQGVHAVVYKVVEGQWKGAYAKALVDSSEITATHAVGALYTSGTDAYGQHWAIIKPSKGIRLDRTKAFKQVQHNQQQCFALLNHAIELATSKIAAEYSRTHWLHEDPVLTNVLFDDRVTQAFLIDWGCASQPPAVPLDIKARVTNAFWGSNICGPPLAAVHRPVTQLFVAYHCPVPAYFVQHPLPLWH